MHHATSPAVPRRGHRAHPGIAAARGWALDIFDAGEFADPAYRANPVNRCFFCKTNLYGAIAARTERQILSGTNLDDLGDYRPGLEAARTTPCATRSSRPASTRPPSAPWPRGLGLGALAELPSAPCLSSRVETGLRIEPATLDADRRDRDAWCAPACAPHDRVAGCAPGAW